MEKNVVYIKISSHNTVVYIYCIYITLYYIPYVSLGYSIGIGIGIYIVTLLPYKITWI